MTSTYVDRFAGYTRSNRRRDKRRSIACPIVAGPQRMEAATKDLSLGGFSAAEPMPGMDPESVVSVELQTPSGVWLRVDARVIRNGGTAQDFAAAFVGLSQQAFADLQRIVTAPARVH